MFNKILDFVTKRVLQCKNDFSNRGSDQGGGVGGINYAEYSDGSELNYKFYNLRGDVVLRLSEDNTIKSTILLKWKTKIY